MNSATLVRAAPGATSVTRGRAHAVRVVQHEAVGDAAVRLERALLGRQHGDRERHALRRQLRTP